jgi:cleavage and polyadenylation specificity factor subunit 3
MIEGTTSFVLAQRWLLSKNFGIFFVGYIDPLTPAQKVVSAKAGDFIQLSDSSEEIKAACDVQSFRFTSHSNRDDLIKVVEKLKPKTVILVHGEKDGYDWIGKEILTRFPKTRVILPEVGKDYELKIKIE